MEESTQQELQVQKEEINSASAEVSMIFDDLSKIFNEVVGMKRRRVKNMYEHNYVVDLLYLIDNYDFKRLIKIRSSVCTSIYDYREFINIDEISIMKSLYNNYQNETELPNSDSNVVPTSNPKMIAMVEDCFSKVRQFLQGNHLSDTKECVSCLKRTNSKSSNNEYDLTPMEIAATFHFTTVTYFLSGIGTELYPLDIMLPPFTGIPKAINSPLIVRVLPKGMVKEIFHLVVFIAYQNDLLIHWKNGRRTRPSKIVYYILKNINSPSSIDETMKTYYCKRFQLIIEDTNQWDPVLIRANAFAMKVIESMRCSNFSKAMTKAMTLFK
ncbi:uncharacterized protein LOC122498070 [Leptopilina heterotoma]|uniref:uncharacterized protein LOC122498070 n=1 Tax=Leptopilina heterotoma TaxID=63436 RepID=UPI001CA90EAF|nr:uncharacterized protein LOC122498070 [Leptopilina heterotoma]XP_043461551.1 uncharacterized protein LOC122498070 [Leptopilina heterotoma]XP_043461552.1 uncharacterized protein LOC122498070 [Leptopilina heterotoma]XP_043461554.1 uncharacterized protein LOC122498070 [Leptopilina heterotoma]XP_043461555.1 uncharacterized protein LOC122498070 [Leptopilina heterotoma]XP_043461556.1 uncharacterized protein LOC122498070 [Leptopilina heterotoma]